MKITTILVKRLIIFTVLIMSLVFLQLNSESSLLLNLPTQETLENALSDMEEQEEVIQDVIEEELGENPDDEYNELFNNAIRHTFIVEFTTEEFNGVIDDMLKYQDQYGTLKSNNYRNVTVTYISDDNVQVFDDVGFRTKGHIYSRRLPIDESGNVREVHFMLKFNHTFDLEEDTPEFVDLKKREAMGIEQLLFKWNNVYDPANMNEVYSYQMLKEAGVVVPEASFAEVQIVVDGKVELVAFYNIFEHFDEEFIRRHLQETPKKEVGDLYKVSFTGTLYPIEDSSLYGVRNTEYNMRPLYSKETNKEIYSYDRLVRFSYGINQENKYSRLNYLEENFNIDSFLRAMAMTVLLGNPDDYRGNANNFYYYFDETGKLTYLPYDYDNSIGTGWDAGPHFIEHTLGNDIYEWGYPEWNPAPIPLWDHIIEHEKYQIIYEDYLLEFIDEGIYSTESYLKMYNTIEPLYNDIFTFTYQKEYYITRKIELVEEQVEHYKNLRE